MTFHAVARRVDRRAIACLVCSVLIPVGIYLVFAVEPLYTVFESNTYLTFHTSVEIFSALVGLAIAYVCFAGYGRTGSRTILLLGTAFLVQAALDPIHAFVFPGVVNPFIQSGTNQAIYIWLVARISGALLLLLSAALPDKETRPAMRNKILLIAILGVTLLTAMSAYAVRNLIDILPPMFVAGKGLTLLKIGLEDVVTVALVTTALFYLRRYWKSTNKTLLMFTIGVTILVFSEIGFMLYASPYDIYNFLGHLFKLSAFLLFLFGLLLAG